MSIKIRESLATCYRQLGEARLGSGASGNVSLRSGDSLFITPTGARPESLLPEQVVEIAIDGVQASTRYPGGVALRFARVRRYRDDKQAASADTIDQIRALLRPR